MAAALKTIEGRFILTLNDLPETRKIYQCFRIETVDLTYKAGGCDNLKPAREIIVSN